MPINNVTTIVRQPLQTTIQLEGLSSIDSRISTLAKGLFAAGILAITLYYNLIPVPIVLGAILIAGNYYFSDRNSYTASNTPDPTFPKQEKKPETPTDKASKSRATPDQPPEKTKPVETPAVTNPILPEIPAAPQMVPNLIPFDVINRKITEYLSTHTLAPFIPEGRNRLEYDGFIPPVSDQGNLIVQFLGGRFVLPNNSEKNALFQIIKNKNTNEVTVSLSVISNGPLINPRVFNDIIFDKRLQQTHPKALRLLREFGHVNIDTISQKNGTMQQNWTFFTPHEQCEVPITLRNRGRVGTDYVVSKKN